MRVHSLTIRRKAGYSWLEVGKAYGEHCCGGIYGTERLAPGPVVHLEVFGRHIILLNTAQAVSDLLDKRSGIYSDRPPVPMMDLSVSVLLGRMSR